MSSISLAELWSEWIMNSLDNVRGLEAEGYLQLNSDESTDALAPKLSQQCVARWRGWSSFNPGWASAMFRRVDHAHCLRLLDDLWYSMRLVSGNCRVMFPREFRGMLDWAAAYVQCANFINTSSYWNCRTQRPTACINPFIHIHWPHIAINVEGRNFSCSQELDNGTFEPHVFTAFHFDWHWTRVMDSYGFRFGWHKVDGRYYMTAWNPFYPLFSTLIKYDRGGKTFQPSIIC